MARLNWFQRTTGRAVQVAADCECRSYGRAGCFACTIQPEYDKRPPSTDTRVLYARWWDRFMQHQLDDRDLAFLAGIPYRSRRGW